MRSVEEHQQVISDLLPRMPVISVSLAESAGLVLATHLLAPIDLPPFDNSAMDGYVVRSADITALPVTLPVSDDIPAGKTDSTPLTPGTAARIMTGAPIPQGAEVIVQVEFTDGGTAFVTINDAAPAGQHFRRRGEDVTAGAVVLTSGTVMGATQIGVAAALGLTSVDVFRPVRVLVLSTGTELVAPGNPLGPGQIYESNATMLAAAIREIGGVPTVLQFVPDDAAEFNSRLSSAADDVDLVLTTGGVSAGAYEVVKDALTGQGVDFVKVRMQPGGPQGAGMVRGVPVVTFPGNPVSAYVSFEVFLRPAICKAMGHRSAARPVITVPVSEAVDSPPGKRQFRRALLDTVAGTVKPWGGPGSHLLAWLAGADAILVLGEDVTRLEVGEQAEVWLL
ncbi:molybdopterin molybdenumtransferase MoeA [Nakamurella antarctica]|uniref:Molybdopterin molybdenumtransferase n=1 Tax=Nakamurella antarctica TaxID=1902245 RepID=A0A3G8ZIM0_9ACTN|nr:gephyrin-like molybdotransferase Glp [Nakamurella antarctica]AZI57242.1 molybdopterin molybdenumtransferase MoeA [Nakamurella antarctica]